MLLRCGFVCRFLLLLTFFSGQVGAALLDQDWKAQGDSMLLLDTSTGLRWLDLSVTADRSYNDVKADLVAGGAYSGFRFATRAEVLHLWSEAGITDTHFQWQDNGQWSIIKDLADRLGTSPLFDPHGVGTHALAMVDGDTSLPPNQRRVMEISYHSNGSEVRVSSDHYYLDVGFYSIHYSSYLVQPVPLPPALALMCVGLVTVLGRRRGRFLRHDAGS